MTLFEEALLQNEIIYHPIPPATSKHNDKGKDVTRKIRKDFMIKHHSIHSKLQHLNLRNNLRNQITDPSRLFISYLIPFNV